MLFSVLFEVLFEVLLEVLCYDDRLDYFEEMSFSHYKGKVFLLFVVLKIANVLYDYLRTYTNLLTIERMKQKEKKSEHYNG